MLDSTAVCWQVCSAEVPFRCVKFVMSPIVQGKLLCMPPELAHHCKCIVEPEIKARQVCKHMVESSVQARRHQSRREECTRKGVHTSRRCPLLVNESQPLRHTRSSERPPSVTGEVRAAPRQPSLHERLGTSDCSTTIRADKSAHLCTAGASRDPHQLMWCTPLRAPSHPGKRTCESAVLGISAAIFASTRSLGEGERAPHSAPHRQADKAADEEGGPGGSPQPTQRPVVYLTTLSARWEPTGRVSWLGAHQFSCLAEYVAVQDGLARHQQTHCTSALANKPVLETRPTSTRITSALVAWPDSTPD